VRLADVARLRQAAYRLFGGALLHPDEKRLATLSAGARELEGQSEPFREFAFFSQWQGFLRSLTEWKGPGTAHLEEAYLDLFILNQDVPLCESGFVAPGAPALTMAALEEEYRRAGLSLDASFTEPPDHAAVELEFMGFLCAEEAQAWAKRSLKDAVERLEMEAGFFNRHISRWFPVFAEQVASRARDGFYSSLATAAHAFVEHDHALVSALLAQYQQEATRGC
jgi:TorA maturation chaperone TorD